MNFAEAPDIFRIFQIDKTGPGLSMSRSLGDLWGHECGMIHDPDFAQEKLDGSAFLVLASDGIWDFVNQQEVADVVGEFGPSKTQEAAEHLQKLAWKRWLEVEPLIDDITIIILWLPFDRKE